MATVQSLLEAFERFVGLPWKRSVAGPEKVWFCIYNKLDDRRLTAEITNFEIATTTAGHKWAECNLANALGEWLALHDYRDSYFANPAFFESASGQFVEALAATVRTRLDAADENTLVALTGVASLYWPTSVSQLMDTLAPHIKGRLAVFFPGRRDGNNYRLLDARDGWNYLAIPIEGEAPQS